MPGSGVRTAEHGDLESQYEELDVLGGGRAAHQPERRMLGPVADVEPSSAGLLRLIYGYQVSQAIHVAAALGIADQLAEGRARSATWRPASARTRTRCTGCCAHWRPWRSCTKSRTARSR